MKAKEITTFAQRLKQARRNFGLTQVEFAKRCGRKNDITISRWERGETEPSLHDIAIICHVLRINADWLLGIDAKNLPNGLAKYQKLINKLKKIVQEEEGE